MSLCRETVLYMYVVLLSYSERLVNLKPFLTSPVKCCACSVSMSSGTGSVAVSMTG